MEDKNKNLSDKKLFIITPDELAKLGILDSLTTKVKLNTEENKDVPAATSSGTFKTQIKKNTENLLKSIFSQKKVSDNDHMVFKKPNEPIKSKELKNDKSLQSKKILPKPKIVSKTKSIKDASKGQKVSNNVINSSAVLNKSDQGKIKIISNTPVNIETLKQPMEVNPANEPKKFSIISNTIVNFDKEELNKIVKHSSSSSVTKNSTLIKTQKNLNSKFKKSIFRKPQLLVSPSNPKNILNHNMNSHKDVSKNSNILETILKDTVCDKISKIRQYPSPINRKFLSSISSSSSKLSTIASDHSTNKEREDNSSEPKYKEIKEANVVGDHSFKFKKKIVESTSKNKIQSTIELDKDIPKNLIVMDDKLEYAVAKNDKVLEDNFDISNSHCVKITSTVDIDNSKQEKKDCSKEANEKTGQIDYQGLQIIKMPGSAELKYQSSIIYDTSFSDVAANSSSTTSVPLSKKRDSPKKISQTVTNHKMVDSAENVTNNLTKQKLKSFKPDNNSISSTSDIENKIVIPDIPKKVSKIVNYELDSIKTIIENDGNLKKEFKFNETLSKNISVEDLSKKKVDFPGLIQYIPEKLTSASIVQDVYQVGESTSVSREKPGKTLKTYSKLAKVYHKNLNIDSDSNQLNLNIQGTANKTEEAKPVLNVLPNQDTMRNTLSSEKNKEESESEISISDNCNESINRKGFSVGIKKRSRIPWRNRMSNNQMEISVKESSNSIPDTQTEILIEGNQKKESYKTFESDTLIEKLEPPSKKRRYEQLKTADEKIDVQMAKSRSGRNYVKMNYLEIEGMIGKTDELRLQLTDAKNISVSSSNMVESSPKNKRGRKPKIVLLDPVSSYSDDKTDIPTKDESQLNSLEVVNREKLVANDLLVDQVVESVPAKKKRGRPRKSLPSESILTFSKENIKDRLKDEILNKQQYLAGHKNGTKETNESSNDEITEVDSSGTISANSLEHLPLGHATACISSEIIKSQNAEDIGQTKELDNSLNQSRTTNSFDIHVINKSGSPQKSLASESISDISKIVTLKENLDVKKEEDLTDTANVIKEAKESRNDKIAKSCAIGTTSGNNLEQPLTYESDKHQEPLSFKPNSPLHSSDNIKTKNPEGMVQPKDLDNSVNQSSTINSFDVRVKKKIGRSRKSLPSEKFSDSSKEVVTLKKNLGVEKEEDPVDNANVIEEAKESTYDKIDEGSASGTTSGDNLEQPLTQESYKHQEPLSFKQESPVLSSESIKIKNPEGMVQTKVLDNSVNQSSTINSFDVEMKKKSGRPRKSLPSEKFSDSSREVVTLKKNLGVEKEEDPVDNANVIEEAKESTYDKIDEGSASGTTSGDNLEQPLKQESDKHQEPLSFKQDSPVLSSESIKIQNPEGMAQNKDLNDSVSQSTIMNSFGVQVKKKSGRPRKSLPFEKFSDNSREVVTLKENLGIEKEEDPADNANLIEEAKVSTYDKIDKGSASGTTSGDNLEQPLIQKSEEHQEPLSFKQDSPVLSSESIKIQNPGDFNNSVSQSSIINSFDVQVKKKRGRPRKSLSSEKFSDSSKEVVTLIENFDVEKEEDPADNANVIKEAKELIYDKIDEGSASGTTSLTHESDKHRGLLSPESFSPVLSSESIKIQNSEAIAQTKHLNDSVNGNSTIINSSDVPFKKKRGRPRKSVLTEGDCEKIELGITPNKVIDNINNAISTTISNISDVASESGKESKIVLHKDIPSTAHEKIDVPINTANIQNNGDKGIFEDDEGKKKKKRGRKRKNVSVSPITESQREFKTVDNQSNEEKEDMELDDTVNEDKSLHGSNISDLKDEICEEQVYNKMLDEGVSSTCGNSTPVIKKKRGRKPKGTQATIISEKEVKVEEVLPLEESQRGRKRAKVNYLEIERLAADDDEKPTTEQERSSSKDDTFKTRVKIDIPSEKSGDTSLDSELPSKPKKTQTGRYTKMLSDIFAESLKSDNNTEENPSTRIVTPAPVRKGRKGRNANEVSVNIDEEGCVTCGHCEGKMKPEEWDDHNKIKHNNLAWRNGEPILNLDHPKLKSKLKPLLNAKNKRITCLKCQQGYQTTGEFIAHTEECLGIITEGKVTCAVCSTIMPRESWISHKMKHNTLAWRIGEYPLDIQNETFVLQTLNAIYQTRRPLYCYKCNGVKKSVLGLLSHFAQCGKDMEDAKVSCELCDKKMLPVSIPTHMKMMHETPRKVQTPKPGSSYFDVDIESSQQKRNAAKKAIAKMDTLASDTEVTQRHFVKQMNFEEDNFLTKCLNKELEENKTLKCKIKDCVFLCGDTSEMITHLSACSLKPDQYYTCKTCFSIEPSVEEIINHLKIVHSITVKRNDDGDFDENENSNEDELELEQRFRKKKYKKGENTVFKQVVIKPDFILRSVKKQEPNDLLYGSAFQFTINFANKNFNSKLLFENLKCNHSDWNLLNDDYLETYLPSSELSCDVVFKSKEGYQNIYRQEHSFKKFELFETECGDEHVTIFCGGPILCQAWLPTPHTSLDHQQILAVATCKKFDGKYNHNENCSEPTLIQFWNFGILQNCEKWSEPKLEFCLAVNNGPIWAMEWCPSGCFNIDETIEFSRRGLLAVAGCSMTVHIYSIPLLKEEETELFYKPQPVLKLELTFDENDMKRKAFPTKLSWSKVSGHKYLAVGYTDGTVAVYNVDTSSSLLRIGDTLLPYKIIKTHTHFISALSLIPIDEGNRWLLTGSFDKDIHIWDLSSDDKYSIRRKKIIADGAWLTNWLSFMTSNDESTAVGAQALTTTNSYREYMYDQCHLSFSSSSVTSISASDWLNGFIHSNDCGEINAFFPHQMLFDIGKKRKLGKFRFVLGYTKMIDKTLPPEERAAVENEKRKILKYEVGGNAYKKPEKEYLWNEPINYEEATQKYGVAFCDTKAVQLQPDLIHSDSSKPNIYPLQTINKISFNPNRQASLYYATGYQVGFLRLSYLKFLEKDKQIKKSQDVNAAVI